MLSRYMDGSRLVYWNDSNGNLTVPGTLNASNIVGASFSLGPVVKFSSIECSSINSGAILNGSNTAYLTYTNTTAPASDGTINGVSLTALNQRVRPSLGEQLLFTNSTWTSRTAAANYGWRKVAWSPTLKLYCAVSGFPARPDGIMTSPDGITWTLRTLPIALGLGGIIWADTLGRFVAIGADSGGTSYSAVSTDGINWNSYVLPTNGSWLDITWSPQLSRMVAISWIGGTRSVAYSSDGQTWTTIHPNAPSTTNRWHAICWSAEVGLFVAVTFYADAGPNRCVMTSPDGITWTQRLAPATKDWYYVAWSPELKLFAAVSRSGDTTGVMTSPDGVNWTLQTTPAINFTYVSWIPELSMFVALNETSGPTVTVSRNGITWTAHSILPTTTRYYGMVWSREQSKLVVMVDSTANSGLVVTSDVVFPASQNTLLFASPGFASVNNSNGLISMSSMNISTATTRLLTAYSINSTDSNIRYGSNAGASNQGTFGVAIGWNSAVSNQGSAATAVGAQAGRHNQGALAVAVGDVSGFSNQGAGAVAIGRNAAQYSQGIAAVALGSNAGNSNQGTYAIAIGNGAGETNQIANSIILNASNVPLNAATNAGFYVNPVRNVVTNNVAYYDTTTKEITYGAVLSTFNTFSSGWASIGALNTSSLNVNVISSAVANISTVNVNTVIVDYVNVVSTAIVNATTISTAVVGTSTLNVNTISSATGAFNTINTTNVSSAVVGTSTLNVNTISSATISSATGAFNTINATNVSSAVVGTSTLNVNTIALNGNGPVIDHITPNDPGEIISKSYGSSDRFGIGQYSDPAGGIMRMFTTSDTGTLRFSYPTNDQRDNNGTFSDTVIIDPFETLGATLNVTGSASFGATTTGTLTSGVHIATGLSTTTISSGTTTLGTTTTGTLTSGVHIATGLSTTTISSGTTILGGTTALSLSTISISSGTAILGGTTAQSLSTISISSGTTTLGTTTTGTLTSGVHIATGLSTTTISSGTTILGGTTALSLSTASISSGTATLGNVTFINLPTCSAVPTSGSQLVNKTYVDSMGSNSGVSVDTISASQGEQIKNASTWVYQNSINTGYSWYSIAWSSKLSLFAAVGNNELGVATDYIMTSPDGISWTTRTNTDGGQVNYVIWAEAQSKFVAIGDDGTGTNAYTWTSINGIAWNRYVLTYNNYTSICYSPELNLYVAGANITGALGSVLIYSSDGETWSQTSYTSFVVNGVTWSKELGIFVAVGDNNIIYTSSNGITWNPQSTSFAGRNWYSVAWSPKLQLFLAVSRDVTVTNHIIRSADGITWTQCTSPDTTASWRSCIWSPEMSIFMLVGSAGTNRIAYSADGISFTEVVAPIQREYYGLCWSRELSIFIASSSKTDGSVVLRTVYPGIPASLNTVMGNPAFINYNNSTNILNISSGLVIGNGKTSIVNNTFILDTTTSTGVMRMGTTSSEIFIQTGTHLSTSSVANLKFTGINGSPTHMILTSNGNLGIGITNPANKLDVVGNANVTGNVKGGYLTSGTWDIINNGPTLIIREPGWNTFNISSQTTSLYTSQFNVFGNITGGNIAGGSLDCTGSIKCTGNTGLPASISGFEIWAGGFASPVASRHFIGDGSGWTTSWSSRTGGVTTDRVTITDQGNLTVNGNIQIGSAGNDYNKKLAVSGGGNSMGYVFGYFPTLGDGINLSYNYYADVNGNGIINPGLGTSRLCCSVGSIRFYTGGVNTAPTEVASFTNSGLNVTGNTSVGNNLTVAGNYQINGAVVLTANNFIKAKGVVNADGTLESGSYNINSSVKNSTGNYTITFQNTLPNTTYSVVISPCDNSVANVYGNAIVRLTGSVQITMSFVDNLNLNDCRFSFIVV